MVAAAVGVGAAVVGGVASNAAASKQAGAAKDAADQQSAAAGQLRSDLQPYTALGNQAINPLWKAMGYGGQADPAAVQAAQAAYDDWEAQRNMYGDRGGAGGQQRSDELKAALQAAQQGIGTIDPNSPLQKQFSFDPANLQNTPGYQFTLAQGLKSTNNALAAQGLGLSGAQAKGLSGYATGLADQTYNQQYNNALSTYNTNYQVAANNVKNLQDLVNTGQNSAAQTGQAGLSAANSAGNYLTQAGNAQAAGITGTANALNSGINNYLTYNALYK